MWARWVIVLEDMHVGSGYDTLYESFGDGADVCFYALALRLVRGDSRPTTQSNHEMTLVERQSWCLVVVGQLMMIILDVYCRAP